MTTDTKSKSDHVLQKFWRPIAAFVYLAICVIDFAVMPMVVEANKKEAKYQIIEEVMKLDSPEVQIAALQVARIGSEAWEPKTVAAGGVFHLSFGVILGAAAWTRGKEKEALAKATLEKP